MQKESMFQTVWVVLENLPSGHLPTILWLRNPASCHLFDTVCGKEWTVLMAEATRLSKLFSHRMNFLSSPPALKRSFPFDFARGTGDRAVSLWSCEISRKPNDFRYAVFFWRKACWSAGWFPAISFTADGISPPHESILDVDKSIKCGHCRWLDDQHLFLG